MHFLQKQSFLRPLITQNIPEADRMERYRTEDRRRQFIYWPEWFFNAGASGLAGGAQSVGQAPGGPGPQP